MKIAGLQKLSLIDYPRILACTVFLTGCNFRCPWCYNGELVLPEKEKEIIEFSQKDFFNFLKERKNYLEGVCIGGGEPTVNKDLPEFCKRIKKLGYKVKIDTNGSDPQMLENLIKEKLVDYIAMDIKAPSERYPQVIGLEEVSPIFLLGKIEQSINILKQSPIEYEFRTTVIPGLLEKEDILKITHWLRPAKKYILQNFRPEKTLDPNFQNIQPYPSEYLFRIQKAISPFFEICEVRE